MWLSLQCMLAKGQVFGHGSQRQGGDTGAGKTDLYWGTGTSSGHLDLQGVCVCGVRVEASSR